MGQFDLRKSGIHALVGLIIGLLLLVAVVDNLSSQTDASFADYLAQSSELNLLFLLIVGIPALSGILIGGALSRARQLRRRVHELAQERDKLIESKAVTQVKTEELQGLLDQESGFFVNNWDQLVTEKDNLREEAEISSALVRVALTIGGLAGTGDVLEMLRNALPAALFADACLTFEWSEAEKAFIGSNSPNVKLKPRSVKAIDRIRKEKKPVSIESVETDELLPVKLRGSLGAKSAILIPCVSRDEVTAIAMVLYSTASHKFSDRDIQIASGIVSQAQIVFENAHLYEDVLESRNKLQRLLTRLASSQEDERRRISRDLHDGVIQNLSGIIFSLNFLSNALGDEDENAKNEVAQLEEIVHDTITDLRKVIYDLRPTILDSLGLVPTLEKHLESFGEANNITIDYNPKMKERLAESVETGLFRLAQETLNNIKKHAQAKTVSLGLEKKKDDVVMVIEDDGVGFDMDEIKKRASQDSGFGLSGMNERVQSLSGVVKIVSKPGEGTRVMVTVPYQAKGA